MHKQKYLSWLGAGLLFLALNACNTEDPGEKLARQYCSSCHLFPEPALLDKKTWNQSLLPEMAERLGLGGSRQSSSPAMDGQLTNPPSPYPDKPMLSLVEWGKIVDYYTKNAPATPLPQSPRPAISNSLTQFDVRELDFQKGTIPSVTYVGSDTSAGLLYVANWRSFLYRLKDGQIIDSVRTESPVTDIDFDTDGYRLVEIGDMTPNDRGIGSLWKEKNGSLAPALKHLNRPVAITRADLNEDGKDDFLLCQHGNVVGSLNWYENLGSGDYRERTLRGQPGARRAIVTDWNRDGKPDVLGLFGQAREGIYLFLNRGGGSFDEQPMVEFPPVYGSTFLEVADMNGDGFDDLIYTNGDNADFSISLKNYHGIRIYLNDRKGGLQAPWFFPVDGASKVLVRDFDGDGDPDMALISFFPDPQKNDSFLYFENTGQLNFNVSTFPGAGRGRWLVACANDIDGDGDEDIVLGSYLLKRLNQFNTDPQNPPPSVVVLENRKMKAMKK